LDDSEYVGRLLLLGYSTRGKISAAYRLASKSFPHRRIALVEDIATVRPKPSFELEAVLKNLTPYHCLGFVKDRGILAANGRHFSQIFCRMSSGRDPARSISEVLESFGPEADEFLTPRICGFISESSAVVGIVTRDGVKVLEYPEQPGWAVYVSTYVRTNPDENFMRDFDFSSVYDVARCVHEGTIFRKYSNRICTVAGAAMNRSFALACWP